MTDTPDDLSPLGMTIDMLDADRLRLWADLLDGADGDIVSTRTPLMRDLASRLEQAVRDIGVLREQVREQPTLTDEQILQMLDEVHQAKRDGASVVRGAGMNVKDGTVMIEEAVCATVRAFLTQAGVLASGEKS